MFFLGAGFKIFLKKHTSNIHFTEQPSFYGLCFATKIKNILFLFLNVSPVKPSTLSCRIRIGCKIHLKNTKVVFAAFECLFSGWWLSWDHKLDCNILLTFFCWLFKANINLKFSYANYFNPRKVEKGWASKIKEAS